MEFLIGALLLAAAFYVGWNIGANDAANCIGTTVGARVLSYRNAALMMAAFVILGAGVVGCEFATIFAGLHGRLTKFEQSYLLESEPEWGLTYISQFALEFEAKAPFRTIRQNYKAVITEATFFFASSELEQEFVSAQLSDVSRR